MNIDQFTDQFFKCGSKDFLSCGSEDIDLLSDDF